MVKNLPANAEDMGSTPGLGTKIPHATGQLSLCATTGAYVLRQEKALQWEACAPQLENAPAEQQRLSTAKNKAVFKRQF